MNKQALFQLIGILIFLFILNTGLAADSEKGIKPEGYRCVINYEEGFIAAGSDGRIDWLSKSGKITKSEKYPGEEFNCLLSYYQMIVAAGSKGSILISSDKGVFRKIDSGTDTTINSLALFNENIIVGADNGELLIGDKKGLFRRIQLELKGNIVSVSANASTCFGVTDAGEIFHTTNGANWTIFDFNKEYLGYYKPCSFTKILVTEKQIAIIGKHDDDGSPVLLFSAQGNVWTERTLNYSEDQGMQSTLAEIPNDLFYDNSEDQFILVCTKGALMTIPSCSHCNKLFEIATENLIGISGNENTMIVVGDHYFIKVLTTKW